MSASRTVRQSVWLLWGALVVGCNPTGLQPVDDTGDRGDDTGNALPDVLGILVTPERVAIPLGGEVQLKATGVREDRTSLDVTNVARWVSLDPDVAVVSDGLDEEGVIKGLTVGETEVWADLDGLRSVPVRVNVTDAQLLGLSVLPAEVTVQAGQVVNLRAEAAFSDGSRADTAGQVIWATNNPAVVTLEAGGKLTGVAEGTTTIHAEWQGTRSKDVPVSVVAGAAPDLRVSGVSADTGADQITMTVKVKNDGTVSASDFWVDIFVDPPSDPQIGDLGAYYDPVFYLGPGEERTLAYNFPVAPGVHELFVFADVDDLVEESNEDNNTFSHNVSVTTGAESGVNLQISYFDYYADPESILYAIDVYNSGTGDSGSFWLDLWIHYEDDIDESPYGDVIWEFPQGVEAGETEYVDTIESVSALDSDWDGCAYCWSWVKVDTLNNVPETNEDDNSAGPLEVEVPSSR